MDVSDVYVFNQVATNLSFTKAAATIGVSRSAISKRIRRLEENLGVGLLYRNTRAVSLTDAGRIFLQHTREINSIIDQAVEAVRSSDHELSGTVTLSMPSSLGAALVRPIAMEFQASWPNVRFSIDFNDEFVNLIAGGFDLAIRISPELEDSSLIARRLISTRRILVASRAYVEKCGAPDSLEDLKYHRCLGFGKTRNVCTDWIFKHPVKSEAIPLAVPAVANSVQALVLMACSGTGIIYVPEICITNEIADGCLQVVVPNEYAPESYGVFAVYPQRGAGTKVKALVDFVQEELASLSV